MKRVVILCFQFMLWLVNFVPSGVFNISHTVKEKLMFTSFGNVTPSGSVRAANNSFPWKDMLPTTVNHHFDRWVRSDIILQYCLICEPANLMLCQCRALVFALESRKKVVQTFCATTVGISLDIGKLWSASVWCPTVICSPETRTDIWEYFLPSPHP